jgi:hypothetical protein
MNGFFLFQFLLGENGSKVLKGGPWLIGGRVFILQKWERGLDVRKDLLQSVPMRVRFPQLGLHLWSSNIIGRIASTIGKPLYMEKQTYTKSPLVFARVCIEVNRAKKLPSKVWIDVGNGSLEEECVEYEWNFPTFDKRSHPREILFSFSHRPRIAFPFFPSPFDFRIIIITLVS